MTAKGQNETDNRKQRTRNITRTPACTFDGYIHLPNAQGYGQGERAGDGTLPRLRPDRVPRVPPQHHRSAGDPPVDGRTDGVVWNDTVYRTTTTV